MSNRQAKRQRPKEVIVKLQPSRLQLFLSALAVMLALIFGLLTQAKPAIKATCRNAPVVKLIASEPATDGTIIADLVLTEVFRNVALSRGSIMKVEVSPVTFVATKEAKVLEIDQ